MIFFVYAFAGTVYYILQCHRQALGLLFGACKGNQCFILHRRDAKLFLLCYQAHYSLFESHGQALLFHYSACGTSKAAHCSACLGYEGCLAAPALLGRDAALLEGAGATHSGPKQRVASRSCC